MFEAAKKRAEEQVKELQEKLQAYEQAEKAEKADHERLARQEEQVMTLDKTCEDLQKQNRELMTSLQQMKNDRDGALGENGLLKDELAEYKDNLNSANSAAAQLAGHNNHKQKIQLAMRWKTQIGEANEK